MTAPPRARSSFFSWLVIVAAVLIVVFLLGKATPADGSIWPMFIDAGVICAPRTSPSCPSESTAIYNGPGKFTVDVILVTYGDHEPNEHSSVSSAWGQADCGPIPDGQTELYCTTLAGELKIGETLVLTATHLGGEWTGSHFQRYSFESVPDPATGTPSPSPSPTGTVTPSPSPTLGLCFPPTPPGFPTPAPPWTPTPCAPAYHYNIPLLQRNPPNDCQNDNCVPYVPQP